MNIFTLSFGASLFASGLTFFIYIHKLDNYQYVMLSLLLVIGLLFLTHGTGLMREKIINPILRRYRSKHPKIAVINDLPWSAEKKTYAWAWSEMTAEKWQKMILKKTEKGTIKTKVNLINVEKSWVRFFIERYNVIINPYGSVYPEINIKDMTIWNIISSYVLNGGVMVSVADIPFYYAYDEVKEIRYDLISPAQLVPTEYIQNGPYLRLRQGALQPIGTFTGTPFLNEIFVPVYNTEQNQKDGTLKSSTLKLKKKSPSIEIEEIQNVFVNRAFLVGTKDEPTKFSNIRSIVQEIEIDSQFFTPICHIYFGNGHYLISSLFLEYDLQPHNVKKSIIDLMIDLILEEIRGIN